jgi:Xaa-Pro aminopeptidase
MRQSRAKDFMQRCGLDAIIATSPTNIAYFTGYHWWLDPLLKDYMVNPGGSDDPVFPGFAVVPLEGNSVLIVHALLAMNTVHLGVHEVRVFGSFNLDESVEPAEWTDRDCVILDLVKRDIPDTPASALANAIDQIGLATGRLGIEFGNLTDARRAAVESAMPRAALLDCTNMIRLIRSVKSSEEIASMARAAAIAERAALETLAEARPGSELGRLVHDFRLRLAEAGAEYDHLIFGASGLGITTGATHALCADELALVDWGCVHEHYFSDAGTTFSMREPPSSISERFAALGACVDAGASCLKPGVRGSRVQHVMTEALDTRRVTGSLMPHGHGVGLDVRDYPILVPDNGLRIRDDCVDEPADLTLEEDMVIALEVSQYLPGIGSLNHERMFVVGGEGGRELVAYEREAPVQGAGANGGTVTPARATTKGGTEPGRDPGAKGLR